jgi:hypothetical protein
MQPAQESADTGDKMLQHQMQVFRQWLIRPDQAIF